MILAEGVCFKSLSLVMSCEVIQNMLAQNCEHFGARGSWETFNQLTTERNPFSITAKVPLHALNSAWLLYKLYTWPCLCGICNILPQPTSPAGIDCTNKTCSVPKGTTTSVSLLDFQKSFAQPTWQTHKHIGQWCLVYSI